MPSISFVLIRCFVLTTVALSARTDLVEDIIKRMFKYKVLHIRGTPASGKSVLLTLIKQYLAEEYPGLRVIHHQYWPAGMDTDTSTKFIESSLEAGMNDLQWELSDRVLLLDEAQGSYYDPVIWNGLLKQTSQGTGIFAVLFSCYGAPGIKPISITVGTPLIFSPEQRIGLSQHDTYEGSRAMLLLTEPEAMDICTRSCSRVSPTLVLSADLCRWLHQICGGHVGALKFSFLELKHLRMLKNNIELQTEDVSSVLFSDLGSFFLRLRVLPFARGFPGDEEFQKPGVQVLFRAMLDKGLLREEDIAAVATESDCNIEEVHTAAKCAFIAGWIHATLMGSETIFIFPSPIHRWLYVYKLLPLEPSIDAHRYSTPLHLTLAVLRWFKPSQRRLPSNIPENGLPPEALFTMEYYRCLHKLLQGNVLPSPEFGNKGIEGGGAVEFFIPGYAFGMELLVDGTGLKEHYQRFLPGGQYHKWLVAGTMKQWAVLDFRCRAVFAKHTDMTNLFHICFSQDYRRVTVMDTSLQILDQFSLVEN
ncbi:hypothetical protein K440DRAFT_534517 [Wilcoxina mikolae CBS 423.85]|nr:hypothetical protein K440DRAFT_534517 [Wilcoxina mikolae CBS 423.85]